MDVFNEYKNKYYRAVQNTINDVYNGKQISKDELEKLLSKIYEDQPDFDLIKNLLKSGFFKFDKNGKVLSGKSEIPIRFNKLELSYLKLFVEDERFNKILEEDVLKKLKENLKSVKAPNYNKYWTRENIDKFGNDLNDESIREKIITIKNAISSNKYIRYTSKNRNGELFKNKIAYPYKIEYSIKNNKYRLIIFNGIRAIKINIEHIITVEIYDKLAVNGEKEQTENFIKNKKNTEKPLVLKIENTKHSLDRCLNLFSYYDKRYYYNENDELILTVYYYEYDEAEIILNILRLGKSVVVLEPEHMKEKIIDRIKNYKFD